MVRVVRSCSEDRCPYEGIYTIPRPLCEWHWQLWFSYGDEPLALEDLRRSRATNPDDDRGFQRPITFLDRMGNDADRRFSVDLGNAADTVIEVRTSEISRPSLRLVASDA